MYLQPKTIVFFVPTLRFSPIAFRALPEADNHNIPLKGQKSQKRMYMNFRLKMTPDKSYAIRVAHLSY